MMRTRNIYQRVPSSTILYMSKLYMSKLYMSKMVLLVLLMCIVITKSNCSEANCSRIGRLRFVLTLRKRNNLCKYVQ